jgi:hypothetical protein
MNGRQLIGPLQLLALQIERPHPHERRALDKREQRLACCSLGESMAVIFNDSSASIRVLCE